MDAGTAGLTEVYNFLWIEPVRRILRYVEKSIPSLSCLDSHCDHWMCGASHPADPGSGKGSQRCTGKRRGHL
ncbi:hypothetical protein COMA2_170095 [Candidatus Nitrospira nitrificans]|uniref:Uncharacterized protein n=1 Tax=Candidatus Nitrospira nitrificans TaxID=1742973 RepID=A0A0S4LBR7_9BACT|nr:hypothetical protein COMA2_170095 [Candidatus Nitrospira nitrificans]